MSNSFDSERLKQLREQRGWSQTDLAQKINVSKQTIHEYVLGRKSPSREKLAALADLFNTSVDYLMGRTDVKEPINKLMKELQSSSPNLIDIVTRSKPTIDGVPIDEETAKILYYQLKAFKEKLLAEMEEKKREISA